MRFLTALRVATMTGFLAVVGGRFGVHGLKCLIPGAMFDTYEAGVRYHHTCRTLAMLACVGWIEQLGRWASPFHGKQPPAT